MLFNPIADLLQRHGTLILDGALATELEARGCRLADALWSAKVLLEDPQLIYQVHYDYFAAGAQCAITASYQATPLGFAARGLNEAQARELIARSAELALRAREDYLARQPQAAPLLVAGSVGPYGAYLANGAEYRGDYTLPQAEMMAFHRPRIEALAAAGVDLLACETLPSYAELEALEALLAEFPQLPAWFSFTLRDSEHLSDGTPLTAVAALLNRCPQALALGINCIALEKVTPALETLRRLTDKPLLAYPNSGEQYDAASKSWHSAPAGCSLQDKLAEWQAAGAQIIGGCCRTTPQDIAALARCCHSVRR
ncbi:homocysteine S-methyltransferase [Mixta tenebrionis]|uniref:S-methylmethionine:homocysteine methyltransferase n=1 Tax=Mixta tenebrionis TaxID=2562439 RepID=A0A506VBY1_9GAMM|nr:homocysteine S-methyltransferase [Mixta tenebrionis]TPW42513.1 homocysteine S-methyltransferase [Mixta tenebrionis]